MAKEIHQNDIGTVFKVTVQNGSGTAVDVSGATTKQLIFRKPDGTNDTQSATFFTDGTDGILTYTTISGDIDTIGAWQIQANLVLASGTFLSDIAEFAVHENL